MKYVLYLIFLIFCLVSCKQNIEYSRGYIKLQDTELGEVLCLEREDTTCYRYLGDGTKFLEKGTFVKYHNGDRIDTVFIWGESVVVPSHVFKMISDSLFIIVDQKPLDSIFGKIVDIDFSPHREHKPDNYDEAIQSLNESNIHYYWIINKKSSDIYGPLSKKDYSQKRVELKICNDFTLNE